MKLFVYGTLCRGHAAHNRLMAPATFLGTGTIKGIRQSTTLFKPGEGTVAGELYEIPDSAIGPIDEYEGHPSLYERREIPVTLSGGAIIVSAWVYHYARFTEI